MKIGLASDHGGYELKEVIKNHLEELKIDYLDLGTHSIDSVDYPDFGQKAAEAVLDKTCDEAIVCCGTGIGISIAANKVPGIRCALLGDVFSAKMARVHNNANMIALGCRVLGKGLALEIVDAWLNARFEGDRHQKRIDKINLIEEKYCK